MKLRCHQVLVSSITVVLFILFDTLIPNEAPNVVLALEPITMTAGVIAGVASLYGLYKTNNDPLTILDCQYRECCHPRGHTSILSDNLERLGFPVNRIGPYIRFTGYETLKKEMQRHVHGQPLIMVPIYESIKAHLKDPNPPKALVMYFSGWTGTGKTFVSNIIAKSLYAYGTKSRFVRKIMASHDFPSVIDNNENLEIYRRKMRDIVREQMQVCENSLFIIDEVDKLPQGIMDSLKAFVDYDARMDGINYNKAIFLLMSNTGAKQLNDYALEMYKSGKRRDDPAMVKALEDIMTKGSFSEDGGLKDSVMIDKFLIDVFVPFLPLERQHVKLCVLDEIAHMELNLSPSQIDQLADTVVEELTYTPPQIELYSKSGCKQVHKKVAIAHKMMISDKKHF